MRVLRKLIGGMGDGKTKILESPDKDSEVGYANTFMPANDEPTRVDIYSLSETEIAENGKYEIWTYVYKETIFQDEALRRYRENQLRDIDLKAHQLDEEW